MQMGPYKLYLLAFFFVENYAMGNGDGDRGSRDRGCFDVGTNVPTISQRKSTNQNVKTKNPFVVRSFVRNNI
jgi:hypothetical protein